MRRNVLLPGDHSQLQQSEDKGGDNCLRAPRYGEPTRNLTEIAVFIGDILVAHGLVTQADVAAALEHQKTNGGRLGDNLIALGKLKPEDLEAVMHGAPPQ